MNFLGLYMTLWVEPLTRFLDSENMLLFTAICFVVGFAVGLLNSNTLANDSFERFLLVPMMVGLSGMGIFIGMILILIGLLPLMLAGGLLALLITYSIWVISYSCEIYGNAVDFREKND
jgi:hypothetical protein